MRATHTHSHTFTHPHTHTGKLCLNRARGIEEGGRQVGEGGFSVAFCRYTLSWLNRARSKCWLSEGGLKRREENARGAEGLGFAREHDDYAEFESRAKVMLDDDERQQSPFRPFVGGVGVCVRVLYRMWRKGLNKEDHSRPL